jgi:hypothetical protein
VNLDRQSRLRVICLEEGIQYDLGHVTIKVLTGFIPSANNNIL